MEKVISLHAADESSDRASSGEIGDKDHRCDLFQTIPLQRSSFTLGYPLTHIDDLSFLVEEVFGSPTAKVGTTWLTEEMP